jgi:hypothetical protein
MSTTELGVQETVQTQERIVRTAALRRHSPFFPSSGRIFANGREMDKWNDLQYSHKSTLI